MPIFTKIRLAIYTKLHIMQYSSEIKQKVVHNLDEYLKQLFVNT